MSKLEELVKCAKDADKQYAEYETECASFMNILIRNFEKYLGSPEKIIHHYYIENNEKKYRSSVMRIKIEEDGFWHAPIEIKLIDNSVPGLTRVGGRVYTTFLIKKEEDYFLVRLIHDTKEFKIKDENFIDFYDYFFEEIKELYINHLENLKKGKNRDEEDLAYIN